MTVAAISRRDLLKAGSVAAFAPLVAATEASRSATPLPSDICFSARSFTPDAAKRAREIGATRFEWLYTARSEFVAAVRDGTIHTVGGTINMCPYDSPTQHTYNIGRQQTDAGEFVEAPWLRGEGRHWGCVNSPDFLRIQLREARRTLTAGVDHLQFDDAAGSIPSVDWGGCWCQHCRSLATSRGIDLKKSMRSFQQESTVSFIRELREKIDAEAGRPVTMSCNNFRGRFATPFDLFDFGLCEMEEADVGLDRLKQIMGDFEQIGWRQVITLKSTNAALNRAVMAATHALGGAYLYPHDVYLGSGKPRFSLAGGAIDPLYRFVHLIGPMLDASRASSVAARTIIDPLTMAALAQAQIGVVVRSSGGRQIIHFLPSRTGASGSVNIRLRSVRGEIQSAGSPSARSFGPAESIVANDWTVMRLIDP